MTGGAGLSIASFASGSSPRPPRNEDLPVVQNRADRNPANLLIRGRWNRRLSFLDRLLGVRRVLVRGIGDIGSGVAHRLFREGYAVVIHDEPKPATTRREMCFANAAFDGRTTLEGVEAIRAPNLNRLTELLASRTAIPVYIRPLRPLLKTIEPDILIDARMRKHSGPEVQRGLAPFVVGLGPSLEAGRHADVVVETSWDGLGRVIRKGSSRPLAGEPQMVGGHARERYVYAPLDGVFRTKAQIGDVVHRGQEIAESASPHCPLRSRASSVASRVTVCASPSGRRSSR